MVDTMIRLFDSGSNTFTTNGLGSLPDVLTCKVTEERNGSFELEMTYPVTGKRFGDISLRKIIVAKSNPYSSPQPFRIYSITKPINGIVTINAEHISYDLSGYPVTPFEASSITDLFMQMKSVSVVDCPFSFWTDKTTIASMKVDKPCSMRSLLGGTSGSILEVYGGEYEFDGYSIKLWNERGVNRGVSIRYGKNLTDLKQEENCSNVYTGVYPFWYSEEETYEEESSESQKTVKLVILPEKFVNAPGTYNFVRILPLDLSDIFQEEPTVEQLREQAKLYIKENDIGIPKVSFTVSFVQLAQSEEYKNIANLETVHLCDTVNVEFPELGVSDTTKCIKTEYNALTDKYDSIELGDAKSDLSTGVVKQNQSIQDKFNSQQEEIESLDEEMSSKIRKSREETEEGFKTTVENIEEKLKSEISQTAGEIKSTVEKRLYGEDGNGGEIGSLRSEISQTATEIRTTVSGVEKQLTGLDGDIDTLNTEIVDVKSSISQTADKISFVVSGTSSSNFTITRNAIDLISSQINVKADKIVLDNSAYIQWDFRDDLTMYNGRGNLQIASAKGSNYVLIDGGYVYIYPATMIYGWLTVGDPKGQYTGITVYGTVSEQSDRRVKTDINSLTEDECAKFIESLNPVEYRFKTDNARKLHYGFIAQEVQEVVESIGYGGQGLLVGESQAFGQDDATLTLSYNDFIAPLVTVVQKLMKDVEQLKEKGMIAGAQ